MLNHKIVSEIEKWGGDLNAMNTDRKAVKQTDTIDSLNDSQILEDALIFRHIIKTL